MVHYEFYDNSPSEKQWAYAVSIRPKSHVIDWYCPDCGQAAKYPAGSFDVVLEGGTQFPDFLGCGAYPLLIVSHRVLSTWRDAGVCQFVEYPVGIAAIQDSNLLVHSAPQYFRIEIRGECIIDMAASGISVTGICNRCGEIDWTPPSVRPLRILDGSWDGSDLFRDQRVFRRVNLCTERVVELARLHGFTNASFERME